MTYKQFKQIIDWQIAHEKKIYDAYKLKIDFIGTFDEQQRVVDALWTHILNKFNEEDYDNWN